MPTRLALFGDRMVEAGWLAAVALVPSFFNVYSNRVFEPDKLTLLRAIALIMVVAWLIAVVERFSGWRRSLPSLREALAANPLMMPMLLFVGIYLLATVLSVSPHVSFWGSYQRLQGTLTMASYLVVFFLLCYGLRTRAQLDRLIVVMVLTSVPISLYAVIQHQRWDPLPWGGDVTVRVTSSMGNPIFLAAYLIMVVPFTLYLLGRTGLPLWRAWRAAGLPLSSVPLASLLLSSLYGSILLLQLVTILFTKSRGPWLGWGAGMALFVLLALWRQRQRWLFWGALGLSMVALGFVVMLNLPGSPLTSLKGANTYLERLGSMLETGSGTGRVRMLIWFGDQFGKGALGMITADPFRTLVGWGPESMYVAYSRFYPPDLAHYEARNAVPDRSHNDLLDFLVTTGVLGLSAHLVVVGAFFAYMLKGPYQAKEPEVHLFAIAAMAAVGAHLVEAFFGIAIAATRTLYWAILGMATAALMMPAAAWGTAPAEASSPRSARRSTLPNPAGPLARPTTSALRETPRPSPSQAALARGFPDLLSLAAGLVMATLVLVRSPGGEPNFWLALGVGLAVLFVVRGLLFATRRHPLVWRWPRAQAHPPQAPPATKGRTKTEASLRATATAVARDRFLPRWSNPWLYPFLSYLFLSAFGLYLILGRNVLLGMEPEAIVLLGLAWLIVGFVTTAAWIERTLPTQGFWHAGRVFLYVPLVAVAVVLLVRPLWGVVIADMYFKRGQAYDGAGQYLNSVPAYLKALEWDRNQDFYFLFLGRAFMEQARRAPEGPGESTLTDVASLYELQRGKIGSLTRQGYIQASLVALDEARRLNPLNTDNVANLGRLYRFWAEVTPEPKRKEELFAKSASYYQQATRLSPNTAHLYDEWGLVYFLQGKLQEALDKYQQALHLDERFFVTFAYLGDAYSALNRLDDAASAYYRALALDPGMTNVRNALGAVLVRQGKLEEALQQFQTVAQQMPKDALAHYNMAVVYLQMGKAQEAQAAAEQAFALATDAQKPQVELLLSQVRRVGG